MLHECLDGIRTAPSNGKTMLDLKNILSQEAHFILLSLNMLHSSTRLFPLLALVLELKNQRKNKRKRWISMFDIQ